MNDRSESTYSSSFVPPYRRSWVDALIALIDRVPGPPWVFYTLVAIAFVAAGTGLQWLDGTLPIGTFSAPRIAVDLLVVYGLAAFHRSKTVARSSLETFKPALGELEPRSEALRYELTTLSRRAGVVGLLVSIVFVTLSILGGPEAWNITPDTSPGATAFLVAEAFLLMTFLVAFISLAFHQMRVVVRIHREATGISLLEGTARNGFSTLTLTLSILVALPIYVEAVSYVIAGQFVVEASVVDFGAIVVILITAMLIFIVPLWGLHRRLVREKSANLMAVGSSFGLTTRELHARIAAGDYEKLGGLQTALSSLMVERDVLRRASTWPWEVDTLRGFLSSVALPIVLWLVTALLGRLIGT